MIPQQKCYVTECNNPRAGITMLCMDHFYGNRRPAVQTQQIKPNIPNHGYRFVDRVQFGVEQKNHESMMDHRLGIDRVTS